MTYWSYQRVPTLRGRAEVAAERSVDAAAACDRLEARLRRLAYDEVERDGNVLRARGCGVRRALAEQDAWCAERIEIGAADTPDGVELRWSLQLRTSLVFARFTAAVALVVVLSSLVDAALVALVALVGTLALAGSFVLEAAWIYAAFPAFLRRAVEPRRERVA